MNTRVKKGFGIGVAAMAAVLALSVGTSSAIVNAEVDGVARFGGGAVVQAVVDLTCNNGEFATVSVGISQAQAGTSQFPAGTATGFGGTPFFGVPCTGGEQDVTVTVFASSFSGRPFKLGGAICEVSAFTTNGDNTDQVSSCRIKGSLPLT